MDKLPFSLPTDGSTIQYFDLQKSWIERHLNEHVLPFWLKNSIDPKGGINTCIDDDGTVVSTHKFLWGQWRAVWVFAKLYNSNKADRSFLETALHIAKFSIQYGWDEAFPGWRLIVDRDGQEIEGCTSIYADAFAIYALVELYKATGDELWRTWALKTAQGAMIKLDWPHDKIPHSPYPVPKGARVHGIPMLFSHTFGCMGKDLGLESYIAKAGDLSDEIFKSFYREDLHLILERVDKNGGIYPGPLGSVVNPGHVIEDMWFQIEIAPLIGREDRIPLACDLILRHLEFGWDNEYGGGLLLALDAHGGNEIGWEFPHMKLWWPHTEALYALLLGYRHTQDFVFLEWYEKVWNHCLKYYCDWENGEWRQKLNRDQTPFQGQVVYPVKDPFHMPRSLILQIELLEEMLITPSVLTN